MKKVFIVVLILISLILMTLQVIAVVQNKKLEKDVMIFKGEVKAEFLLINEKLLETEKKVEEQFSINLSIDLSIYL